jgi:hypothetical protein
MEKIEVRYTEPDWLKGTGTYHKYIVYTDSDGNQWATRGGPDMGDLSIVTDSDLYDENFKDWDKEKDDPSEVIATGNDLSDTWSKITQAMDDIEKEDHLYRPMQQNSNTAADEALRRAGLKEPEQDDLGENWSPGSGKPLGSVLFRLFRWIRGTYSQIRSSFQKAEITTSPIALDLDGDGVETIASGNGSYFDHDANGFSEQTGWAGQDDGLLVRDRDGNGTIDSGKELFGDQTILNNGSRASNGFQALSELDDNKDGKIDSNDTAYSQLKIWQDVDGDGYSSADELISLSDAGVASINTGYTDANITDANGNTIKQAGSFTKSDGTTGNTADVYFQVDKTNTIANEWLDVPDDIAALPDLQGYGNVYDLQQAMVRDESGTLKSLVEQFIAETDAEARRALIIPILYKWAGVENIDPLSRAATKIYGNVIKNHTMTLLSKRTGDRNKGMWFNTAKDRGQEAITNDVFKLAA